MSGEGVTAEQDIFERAVDRNLCSFKIETCNIKCAVAALLIGRLSGGVTCIFNIHNYG